MRWECNMGMPVNEPRTQSGELGLTAFAAELVALDPSWGSLDYRRRLARELVDLGSVARIETIGDISGDAVECFLRSLMARRASRNTIYTHLAMIRRIGAIAVARGYLLHNPAESRRRWIPSDYIAGGKPVTRLESADVARLLIRLLEESSSWKGQRLYALVATIVYAGLARSRVLNLEWSMCDMDRRLIQQPGLRSPVPMPAKLCEVLADWQPHAGSNWVFPAMRLGGPWGGEHGQSGVLLALQVAGNAADVPGVTFEKLRLYHSQKHGHVTLPDFECLPSPRRKFDGPPPFTTSPTIEQNRLPTIDLSRGRHRILIRGRPGPSVSRGAFAVLAAMVHAGCNDGATLTGPELKALSGGRDAIRILRALREHPELAAVLRTQGRKGRPRRGPERVYGFTI